MCLFYSVFQAAVLLIKEKIGLDAVAGLGHLISLPKPRSLPQPWAIRPGDRSPLGNEQEAERWRRGSVMGGELKKQGGVFCPSAHKNVTVFQINPLSIVQPLMTSDPLFLSQC